MNITSVRIIGLARLGVLTALLLLAAAHVRADDGATDRHEIPTFVSDRTDLATGADGSLRAARPRAAAPIAADGANPGVLP
jgi:hypothetical protein